MSFFELRKVKIEQLIEYKNIGEQTIQALKRHRIMNLLDLLFYYPNSCQQVPLSTFRHARNEQIMAVSGEIVKVSRTSNAKIKYTVEFKDTENTIVKLLFTNNMPLSFKSGQKMIIMGKYSYKTFVHPKIFYSTQIQWQSDQFNYNVKLPLSDYRMQQCINAAMQYITKMQAQPNSKQAPNIQQNSTMQSDKRADIESEYALNKCMDLLTERNKRDNRQTSPANLTTNTESGYTLSSYTDTINKIAHHAEHARHIATDIAVVQLDQLNCDADNSCYLDEDTTAVQIDQLNRYTDNVLHIQHDSYNSCYLDEDTTAVSLNKQKYNVDNAQSSTDKTTAHIDHTHDLHDDTTYHTHTAPSNRDHSNTSILHNDTNNHTYEAHTDHTHVFQHNNTNHTHEDSSSISHQLHHNSQQGQETHSKSAHALLNTDSTSQYTHIPSSSITWKLFFEYLHGKHGSKKYSEAIRLIPYLESIAWHLAAKNTQVQQGQQQSKHYIYTSVSSKYQALYDTLISTLTSCQATTFTDIQNDLKTGDSRHRMIFGDVCTGKTRISILAALYAISHGHQVLFLAPTTMLARQHYETFRSTFGDQARIMLHSKNADTSQADIIIGTHSLLYISDMSRIGLIIIDEQHKFGVLQRHNLISKDENNQSYILSLSATPIPRSLSLIMQKYINVSILRTRTRPVSIKTVCIDSRNTDEIIARLKDKPGMIYWVCPAIEENETGLMSVEQRYESIRKIYGEQVKFLHGNVHSDEQAEIYQQALAGQIKILVSTTVIEVGIDIPHANIIIIEHAERFGLAQLHQLRGRVGRHGVDGTCVLLHGKKLSEKSRTRLEAMEKISNGLELSEIDMEIRGHGMLLGTQQSGFNEFHYIDPIEDCQILLDTNQIAQNMSYEANLDFINHFFSPDSLTS